MHFERERFGQMIDVVQDCGPFEAEKQCEWSVHVFMLLKVQGIYIYT